MYNKLFTKILDSTIWLESQATRLIWLTFIAAMDEQGFVALAAPANVAHRARVDLDDTVKALAVLEAPDPASSDPDHAGRRIERVPGGWIVLNAGKYRALVTKTVIQEQTRQRVKRHRDHKAASHNPSVTPVTSNAETQDVTVSNGGPLNVTPSEAVALAEARSEKIKSIDPSPKRDSSFSPISSVGNKDVLLALALSVIRQFPDYKDSDQRDELKIALAKAHLNASPFELITAYDRALYIASHEPRS